jgi:hypothetical protein
LWSGLLRGHDGHHIAVGVVAWLHFVSRALLLRGHGGHHIAVGVVAWLHFVSRALLLHGRSGHCIAVMFVAWLRWVSSCCVVSWVLLLHGHGGHCVMWLQWALCCVATVGITLHCILCHRHHSCVAIVGVMLRGHGGCHVAVTFVAWPWWVLSRHIVSWSGLLCGHGGCHHAT